MQAIRGMYIFVLASLLVLTGCFGAGVIEDTEGQTDQNENTGTTTSAESSWINDRGTGEINWNISLSSNEWLEIHSATYLDERIDSDGNQSVVTHVQGFFVVKESSGWLVGSKEVYSPIFGGDYTSCLGVSTDGVCYSDLGLDLDYDTNEWSIIYRIHSV